MLRQGSSHSLTELLKRQDKCSRPKALESKKADAIEAKKEGQEKSKLTGCPIRRGKEPFSFILLSQSELCNNYIAFAAQKSFTKFVII